jgi:hypothetical protein
MTVPTFWKLVDRKPVPCDDLREWEDFCASQERHVGWTEIEGLKVSTIFLGVVANPFRKPPLLFETVVFDDYGSHDIARYETWEQAEAAHAAIVAEILAKARKPHEIS